MRSELEDDDAEVSVCHSHSVLLAVGLILPLNIK
jgi:hypothetical protein